MAKKKQQKSDHHKTKLRVGKTLPKGKNVTDTSFKTKKIATHDQMKTVPGEVSLKDILNYLGNHNVSVKKDYLGKLTNYILDNKDSLTLFFPDVLKRVGPMLTEIDQGVRLVVIDVLHTALRLLTDTQVSCFFKNLTSYLNCMLTHSNTAVKRDALLLLDKVLCSHPRVFCRAVSVLPLLLNLISHMPQKGCKRRLSEHISSRLSSQQLRGEVLSHILAFLECLFEEAEEEDEDEREVHWDGKDPLCLPLYLRGGLTPVPLEKLDASVDRSPTTSKEFKDFVSNLLPLLFDIIKGELPYQKPQEGEDNPVEASVISNLNVVVQVLCCVGEWMLRESPFDASKEKEFRDLIIKMICGQLCGFFPYHQLQSSLFQPAVKNVHTVELNLSVSYAYCMFVLHAGTGYSYEDKMADYIKDLYNGYSSYNDKMISLIIKVNKVLMGSQIVHKSYKNGLMLGLYGVLDTHKNSHFANSLYSFFIDISLGYEFKSLIETEAMETWFNVILKEVLYMIESNSINKRFFKYVRQICARKYPYFVELLNRANPENFLDLLKYDNEELHLTVTQMISCLDLSSGVVLDGLIDVICDPSFSLSSATKIIRQLHAKFSGPENTDHEQLYFLKFLLNLGCDSLSLADPSSEVIVPDMLKAVMESCKYTVNPSTQCNRHLKITQVCFECLPCYLEKEPLVFCTLKFLSSVMDQYAILPVHSAVALLKLRREAFVIYNDADLAGCYGELVFSSLMYISVMRCEENRGEALGLYALTELMNSLQLEPSDVSRLVQIINENFFTFGENEFYHILRMTRFLIHADVVKYEHRDHYFNFLTKISNQFRGLNPIHSLCMIVCNFLNVL